MSDTPFSVTGVLPLAPGADCGCGCGQRHIAELDARQLSDVDRIARVRSAVERLQPGEDVMLVDDRNLHDVVTWLSTTMSGSVETRYHQHGPTWQLLVTKMYRRSLAEKEF